MVPPPLLFLLSLGVAAIAQFVKPVEIAAYSFTTGLVAGALLIVAAAGFGAWGIREMRANKTPLEPGHVPSRLVTSGPFCFTRNPLYVALIAVDAGISLMVNSAWFLGGVVILVLLLDRVVICREEATIRRNFGADYDAYVSRVRRWL